VSSGADSGTTGTAKALHEAAAAVGYRNILEVSTKSERQRGQHLSAFYLKVKNERLGEIPLECAFQGSKVFERGGPFTDLYHVEPRVAKLLLVKGEFLTSATPQCIF
jgi:hypothetical protein